MIHYNEIDDEDETLNTRTKKVEFRYPPRVNGDTLKEAYIIKGAGLGEGSVAVFKDNPDTADKTMAQLIVSEGKTEDQALYQLAKQSDNLHPTINITY